MFETATKNSTFGVAKGQVVSNRISEFRRRTYAMYNPLTSYSTSHNPDCGAHSKIRQSYSEAKYRTPVTLAEKPHNPLKSDKSLLKSADVVGGSVVNMRSLAPRELNRPLEFSPELIKSKTPFDTPSKLALKSSPTNVKWIQESSARNSLNKVSNGEYIPSLQQLNLYGRRKQPTKFERMGLWITRSHLYPA